MRKSLRYLCALLLTGATAGTAFAQTTINGTVRNSTNQEPVPAVSVTIKGTGTGTFTDEKGSFRLSTSRTPPFTLVFSSIGFESKEVSVSNANETVTVDFVPASSLGAEVVISASRVPERILESPVSIERMNTQAIRVAAAPNYYDQIANLKGVDLTTSSLTFRTISTRGFNGSGNLRFNQLVDGIDNQAPGLNFAVGNIVGLTELDVDNVELLQGASSALYGSGGMNGTLLMTSKSPFKYQGLSFHVKQGMMHVEDPNTNTKPFFDWALRWAKKIGDRFAFRISAQLVKADDWQATDYRNLARNNVFSSLKDGNRQSDPNYDGVNVFGDEASANMRELATAVQAQTRAGILTATGGAVDIVAAMNGALPNNATPAQIATFIGGFPAALQPSIANLVPFHFGLRNNVFGSQSVSRTGYNENTLVDYETYNVKLSGGIHYKLTDDIEASLMGNWGTGTTVYTGADRYAIKNLKMGQYKLELKAKNWFLRAYTIQENSGDAYTATTAAVAVNSAWKANSQWFAEYTGNYSGARLQGAPDATAHQLARAAADNGRFLPGTPQFDQAFNNAINTSISKGGAKFEDATDMWHFEGQMNLTDYVKFAEVLVGANYRRYVLNSSGTIFADTAGTIGISEVGGYLQLQKWVIPDVLKLTVSGRYDKNENFDGRFTPRATALIKVAKDNSFRLSYQQAYRFPSTQDQWINLRTPASILIGGLPDFFQFYKFGESPAYTAESIVEYRNSINSGTPDPTALEVADFPELKPEIANSYEVGFRGLVRRNILVDAYLYYSEYKDFIGRVAVGRGQSASTNPLVSLTELASPFTTTNYSFVFNSPNTVKAIGWGISVNYRIGKGFEIGGNVSGDKLRDVQPGLVTFFNTPEWRYNITFSNDRIGKTNWGFNLLYRWQDNVLWEGTFGTGEVPSFGTLDAQVSYRLPAIKSLIKIGATNLANKYYTSAFGNPSVGGLYYVGFGYNVF